MEGGGVWTHAKAQTVLQRSDVRLVLELLLVQELELAPVVLVRAKPVGLPYRDLSVKTKDQSQFDIER